MILKTGHIIKAKDGRLYTLKFVTAGEIEPAWKQCIIHKMLQSQTSYRNCSELMNNYFGIGNYPNCSCYHHIVFVRLEGGI